VSVKTNSYSIPNGIVSMISGQMNEIFVVREVVAYQFVVVC